MKRFWSVAAPARADGGWSIELDGKPVRTPLRALLEVPSQILAEAIAEEWNAVGETINPRSMPLTGLANAAIDRVAPDPGTFADGLAKYAEADLACYRAEGPRELVELQSAGWDPLLGWARRRFDVDFNVTEGIVHVDQPAATVERLAHEVRALGPYRLAGLSPLVTVGGSLVAALAVLDGGMSADEAWAAVSLDDRWQEQQWGADEEAKKSLDARRRDFMAGARFLALLEP